MTQKKTVAVFFGGQTVEHDVSVLTGIQAIKALDVTRFDALPVYLSPEGEWFTGGALLRRENYLLTEETKKGLTQVGLYAGRRAKISPSLQALETKLLGRTEIRDLPFDIALPAMHGTGGEDGALQGLFELLGIPFVGTGAMGSAATMDKAFTKRVLAGLGVPVVPYAVIERPAEGTFIEAEALKAELDAAMPGHAFPLLAKPRSLGSSVGVSRVENLDDLVAKLIQIFRMDRAALVEAFVPNLHEYNVAVTRAFGDTQVSAIERPLSKSDLLDFRNKYLNEGGKAAKVEGALSEGMASATRIIEPAELTDAQRGVITENAKRAFDAFAMNGTARVDFLCDSETGEIWFNEINNIPGSLSYYLWEPSALHLSFTDLLTGLIEEGLARAKTGRRDTSAEAGGSVIFKR